MCDRGKSKRNKNRQHHPGKLQTNRVYGCKFTVSQTRIFTEASEKKSQKIIIHLKKINAATKCFSSKHESKQKKLALCIGRNNLSGKRCRFTCYSLLSCARTSQRELSLPFLSKKRKNRLPS